MVRGWWLVVAGWSFVVGLGFSRADARHYVRLAALEPDERRLFDRFDDPPQNPHAVGTVDDAVIVGESKRHEKPRDELAVAVHRFHSSARDAEDRHLRPVHDRRKGA